MVFHNNSLLPAALCSLASHARSFADLAIRFWDFSAPGSLPSHCPLWCSKLMGTTCTAFTDPHFALLPVVFPISHHEGCGFKEVLRVSFAVSWSQVPGKPPGPLSVALSDSR